MRNINWYAALFACAALGGCVGDDGFFALSDAPPPPVEALATAPTASAIPWQLTPASTASIAQGESTIIVASAKYGKVKGTPLAIANLDKPVFAFAKRGRIVDACREIIAPQAKGIGAYSIQAAAAGPVKTDNGARVQQVFFRIVYDRPEYLEVRQSALLCKVDRAGRILEFKPV